ncbi:SPOCS domain-containing protein [uncultured Clostridium sp.]|uniref:SPOCS domain-containing protein n=1 Tax=uncultured Clostridium sp. TaxID=59620 RepID=UPI0028EB309D|nr:SPOCS domain-containing protein [uncultured Clostridium sp.]
MKQNKKNTVDWEKLIREVILLYNEKNNNIRKGKVEKTPDKVEIEKETKIEKTPNKVETIKKNNVEKPPAKTETIKEIKIENPHFKSETRKKTRIEKTPDEVEAIKKNNVEKPPAKTETIKEIKIETPHFKSETRKKTRIEKTSNEVEIIKKNNVGKTHDEVETKKEKKARKTPDKVEIRKENKKKCKKTIKNIHNGTNSCVSVDSKLIPLCTNIPVPQISLNGPLICKLPVILSQFQVEIGCEADINFSKPATNIIDVKSNIHITEYDLIVDVNKLFISGYIRESIQYNNISSSKVKHVTVNIPFQCVTRVEFTTPPVLQKNRPNIKYNLTNGSIGTIGEDDCNDLFFSNNEVLNEKIYCELLSAEILQIVTKLDNTKIEKYNNLVGCKRTKNKFSLGLTIRLYQNQPVNI